MLIRARDLWTYNVDATGTEAGRIHDLQVDDRRWAVRDVVVDLGHWPINRLVLIDPCFVVKTDPSRRTIDVALTAEQIAQSPSIETHPPVARQGRVEPYNYLGVPIVWGPLDSWVPPYRMSGPSVRDTSQLQRLDPHLRSLRELSHYRVEGRDGDAGHVEDWLVDDPAWATPYAVVKTASARARRHVLVPVRWLGPVSWGARVIYVDLPTSTILHAPDYDSNAPLDADYEARLRGWYGHPARRASAAPR